MNKQLIQDLYCLDENLAKQIEADFSYIHEAWRIYGNQLNLLKNDQDGWEDIFDHTRKVLHILKQMILQSLR